MANSTLIGKIHMDCPICNMLHEVEEWARMTSATMKGEKVFYEEHFYVCTNNQTGNSEFQTERLTNNNEMTARNAYRKAHNLLTSDEIVAVRENYGLTQVEAARLLGWGRRPSPGTRARRSRTRHTTRCCASYRKIRSKRSRSWIKTVTSFRKRRECRSERRWWKD